MRTQWRAAEPVRDRARSGPGSGRRSSPPESPKSTGWHGGARGPAEAPRESVADRSQPRMVGLHKTPPWSVIKFCIMEECHRARRASHTRDVASDPTTRTKCIPFRRGALRVLPTGERWINARGRGPRSSTSMANSRGPARRLTYCRTICNKKDAPRRASTPIPPCRRAARVGDGGAATPTAGSHGPSVHGRSLRGVGRPPGGDGTTGTRGRCA